MIQLSIKIMNQEASHIIHQQVTFWHASLLFHFLFINLSKNVHQYSCQSWTCSSIITTGWLGIQEFCKNQWKHSVRINGIYGIYNTGYNSIHYHLDIFLCLLCSSKNDTNICAHFFLSREPVFKHLPAQHRPWLTSQVGFAKPFSKASWNIEEKWNRFARRILSDKTMEMSPRSPSSLPWFFSLHIKKKGRKGGREEKKERKERKKGIKKERKKERKEGRKEEKGRKKERKKPIESTILRYSFFTF